VVALVWPAFALLWIVAMFAAYALLGGIASAVAAVQHRDSDRRWWLVLLLGIVSIVASIFAILNPDLTVLALVLLMGANAIVTGVLDIAVAIRVRRSRRQEWLLVLIGVLSIIFGVLAFVLPAAGALAMVWMTSAYALVTGVLLLTLAIRARSWGSAGAAREAGAPFQSAGVRH
jgi:uncharacterized membrane protein HdeD (DUF308 family)